jgi:hypothetical protein
MYYPMLIYDDAASTALCVLKSRFLYNEIKGEAKICLMSATRTIADSAFSPMRHICTMKLVSRKMAEYLQQDERLGPAAFGENQNSVQLGVMFEQNQVALLGCNVNTKSLITDRLNDLMSQEIMKVVDLTDRHGS